MALFVAAYAESQQDVVYPTDPALVAPSILSRLRLDTRAEHEAVEQVLDLMSAAFTHQGYRQRLEQFYGFYAPLEEALRVRAQRLADEPAKATLSVAIISALALRLTKTAHLQQDLQRLGVLAGGLPLCSDLPPLDTQAEVLGCLYVMEGATLGGRMITQHVRTVLGITPTTGGSFFEGYGGDTGRMWQGMRQLLIEGSSDAQTENSIVSNAISTFACLRGWCESSQK